MAPGIEAAIAHVIQSNGPTVASLASSTSQKRNNSKCNEEFYASTPIIYNEKTTAVAQDKINC
jgi:hypothetical protein